MIKLAQSIGKELPVLFAAFIPRRIAESIEDDFCWGAKQRTWYGDIINQVDSILKKHNLQMIILIDSINEVSSKNSIKIDIIDLVKRLYNTSIKLCLACREEDWRFFYYDKGEPGIFQSLGFHSKSRGLTDAEGQISEESIKINDFSEHGSDLAFGKYSAVFDLKHLDFHPKSEQFVSIPKRFVWCQNSTPVAKFLSA